MTKRLTSTEDEKQCARCRKASHCVQTISLTANQKAWKRERSGTTKISKASSSQRDRYKSHPLSLWQDFQLTQRSHDTSKRRCFKLKKSGPKLFKRDESNVVRIYFCILMYPITNKYKQIEFGNRRRKQIYVF